MSSLDSFLLRAFSAARIANHIWPDYAACESALESSWGTSRLAIEDNNLFGMKQHRHALYGTASMPTREYENPGIDLDGNGIAGEGWVAVQAEWVKYPDWPTCFADRMATLNRLAPTYIHYQNALQAKDGTTYIKEVSATWSTDPGRADKVLAVYRAHRSVFMTSAPDLDGEVSGAGG